MKGWVYLMRLGGDGSVKGYEETRDRLLAVMGEGAPS